MSKRNIGREILQGIRDVKRYKAGSKILRVHTLKTTLRHRPQINIIASRQNKWRGK